MASEGSKGIPMRSVGSSVTFGKGTMTSGTFRYQILLPQLPIPEIGDTCDRFLETVEPLLTEDEFAETRAATEEFLHGKGVEMQESLQTYAEAQDNYVDKFWDDAYLKYDVPIVVNVNPYFVLEDDPTPARNNQMERAVNLVMSALKFVHSIRNEKMTVDMVRKTPLCMSQYPKVLGSARIPDIGDVWEGDKIITTEDSTHIVVMCRNQLYYFDVVTEKGEIVVNADELLASLEAIHTDAMKLDAASAEEIAVGALGSGNRPTWGRMRRELLEESENNKATLKVIDEAIFVLCLDNVAPKNTTEAARNAMFGIDLKDKDGAQVGSVFNRWYDKLCFIVCENGMAMVNFEHSPADGHSVLRMVGDVFSDTIVKFAQSISGRTNVPNMLKSVRFDAGARNGGKGNGGGRKNYTKVPRKLEFDLGEKNTSNIKEARAALHANILEPYAIDSLEYTDYGKKYIVSKKMSPDAFTQMSMMAALKKVTGEVRNTYESVMTKAFLKGRTEAGRSVTKEAKAFLDAFEDSSVTAKEKVKALQTALKAHSAMTKRCSQGQGIDRHLYALKKNWLLNHSADSLPAIFSSPGYKKLGVTFLSTSNCGNPALKLFGFGPVSENGIGIGYIIKDKGISYTFCSKSVPVDRVKTALVEFLESIRATIEEAHPSKKRISLPFVRSSGRPGKPVVE